MGYLIALLAVILVVPLLFAFLSRRSTGPGGIGRHSRGMTVSEPSADQPTPGAGSNQGTPGAERRIPPG